MNSPFSKLILDMQAKIAAELPEIKFIDVNTGQLEQEKPPVLFPCILFDFPEAIFQQLQTKQDGTTNVQMTLATETVQNSSENTPLAVREQALEIFELAHKVYLKFQYWTNAGTLVNVFIRKRQTVEKRKDGLKSLVINFECTFADASAEA